MDLSRDIIYRGFTLNDEDIGDAITGGGAAGTGITGCVLDSVDMSDVDVVQFQEKRSQADGMDVGDVHLGARRLRLAGTLYATTRTQLYDDLQDLRAALNPVLAQREEPANYGYQPLYFSIPTNRAVDYPSGAIALQMYALPRAFQAMFNANQTGGEDDDSLAIPWQATLLCRDPGIYSADPVEVDFTATANFGSTTTAAFATDLFTTGAAHGLAVNDRITFSSITGGGGISTGTAYYVKTVPLSTTFTLSATQGGATLDITGSNITAATWVKSSTASGNWTNRGNYLGKLNMLVEVGAGAGTISVTVGDSSFTLTIPSSSGNRILRVKSDKVFTIEENGSEPLAMSAITFDADTTWPLIDPGSTPYSVTFHGMGGVVTGSRMWFYEQYA